MKIVIITIGTQGDARPFVALGRRLKEKGHDIVIATSDNHKELIETSGLTHAPLRSDFAELMAKEHAALDEGHPFTIGKKVSQVMTTWMPLWAQQGWEATEGADLIIGSGSGTVLGASLSEKRGIPFVQTQFMPLTPSKEIPPLWPSPKKRMPGIVNFLLGHLVRLIVWRVLANPASIIRKELGLEQFSWMGPWSSEYGDSGNRYILYAYSRYLLPQPSDWRSDRIAVTGNWFYDQADAWTAPADLVAFLESGNDKPIYVGFGSMRTGRSEEFTRKILDAIRKSGRRAVVATGWGALAKNQLVSADERIFFVDSVPHDWLFPRVSLAVHHGGAGTVAAAARAGIPQILLPFVADQFFWRWRMHEIGINPVMLDRKTLTSEQLADAIHMAQGPRFLKAAKILGEEIRSEDGIQAAIDTLDKWGMFRETPVKKKEKKQAEPAGL